MFKKYDQSAQIAGLESKMEEIQRNQSHRTPVQRGVIGALVATSQLDGRFQVADAAVIATAVVVAGSCFTIASGAAGVYSESWQTFKVCTTFGWGASGLCGGTILLFELLGLTWPWCKEPGEAAPAKKQVVVHEILVEVKHPGGIDRINVEAAEYERTVLFARECVKLRATNPNPAAEKYWIGPGLLWSNGTAGRAAFGKLRADLVRTGLWTRTNAGCDFTPEGWEFIEETAQLPRR